MSGHALLPRDRYQLRNDPAVTFSLSSSATGAGAGGCTVRIAVTRQDGLRFRYEVVFRGEYSASKANFSDEMYHETALSVARSQLESRVHRDTRIVLEVNSGLPRTQVDPSFDWQEP